MKGIIYSGIILVLSLVITTQTAMALAEVKSSVVVDKSTVTLGDLLDNLDTGQDIWVMNAPGPGEKTSVSTRYLANLTRQHNVYWQNSRGIRQITVTRRGKIIRHEALKYLIRQELEDLKLSARENGIRFENKNAALHLPGDSSLEDITMQAFDLDQQTGKFSAILSVPDGNDTYTTATVRGRIHAITFVPALNKTILPGRQITTQDIAWVPLPTLGIGRNILRTKNQLIGMTPRRNLNPSTPLRPSDLERPVIIKRGNLISILFQSGKINLTASGKAIESGGRGDVIRVMNSKSHKTIDAVVTGPGRVQVITVQYGLAQLNMPQ